MSFSLELINGVTKSGNGVQFIYTFPIAVIIAQPNLAAPQMVITYTNRASEYQEPLIVLYSEIDDVLLSTNIEEYVDQLATESYFFTV